MSLPEAIENLGALMFGVFVGLCLVAGVAFVVMGVVAMGEDE